MTNSNIQRAIRSDYGALSLGPETHIPKKKEKKKTGRPHSEISLPEDPLFNATDFCRNRPRKGSVSQLANGNWLARISICYIRYSRTFGSKSSATRWLNDIKKKYGIK